MQKTYCDFCQAYIPEHMRTDALNGEAVYKDRKFVYRIEFGTNKIDEGDICRACALHVISNIPDMPQDECSTIGKFVLADPPAPHEKA